MKAKSIFDLPKPDNLAESDGIVIARAGELFRVSLAKLREHIAFSTGAKIMGVPIPTPEAAGKIPTVKPDGTGYEFGTPSTATLIHNNKTPSKMYPGTIALDLSQYKLFNIILADGSNIVVEKGTTATLSGPMTIGTSGVSKENRKVTVGDTGFQFETGTRCTYSTGGKYEYLNGPEYAVPVAIYGIK